MASLFIQALEIGPTKLFITTEVFFLRQPILINTIYVLYRNPFFN